MNISKKKLWKEEEQKGLKVIKRKIEVGEEIG